jgi:DNA-binding MarR family transcriptional regulator
MFKVGRLMQQTLEGQKMVEKSEVVRDVIQWMELSTTRSMREWGRYVKDTELSLPQFGILMRLYYRGGCGISDISKRAGVSSAAVSQLIEKLVEKQLIERNEDPTDRRAKTIDLSRKGRELVETSIEERYHWVDKLVANLTIEEQETVSKALPSLIQSFQKIE